MGGFADQPRRPNEPRRHGATTVASAAEDLNGAKTCHVEFIQLFFQSADRDLEVAPKPTSTGPGHRRLGKALIKGSVAAGQESDADRNAIAPMRRKLGERSSDILASHGRGS